MYMFLALKFKDPLNPTWSAGIIDVSVVFIKMATIDPNHVFKPKKS